MQKSAAAIARIACDTGEPSTIGRSTRYQIAPGPGTPNWPRAARSDIPVTKGLEEKSTGSTRDCSGPGSSTFSIAASGGNSLACILIFSTVALTTTTPSASSLTAQSWILRPSRKTSLSIVSGATGTGRIRSTVTRATRIATGVGIAPPPIPPAPPAASRAACSDPMAPPHRDW